MARINPITAKRQREKLGLSMDDLAERSGVDKGTIYRTEAGKIKRSNKNTISKLSSALKISPEELVSDNSSDIDSKDTILYCRSQMNVRISHESRNALALVVHRYKVRAIDIIEFAPLLFFLVAEESLRARAERLSELRAAREALTALDNRFGHITERLLNDWSGEEIELEEERSIMKRDLRSKVLDEANLGTDIRRLDYDDGEHNPFIVHLRERLALMETEEGALGEVEAWHDGWAPRYQICRTEALAYFGGDTEVAENVLHGVIGLHEIPKDLRAFDVIEARLEWARQHIRQVAERQVDLLELTALEDINP